MALSSVRVRFAPSPTGPLHIGGVRTALYNFLFARSNGGTMILRIEDTDQNRYVPGAEEYILQSLEWCGIELDESIRNGGPYGPYRQSERKEQYRQYAEHLIDSGSAYYAFDTEDELEAMRNRLKDSESHLLQYGPLTRMGMVNSLTMSDTEVRQKLKEGVPYVIRIRMPESGEIRVQDLIRGEVVVQTSHLDDKVLFKSDGWPTYHLANVVDDHLMKITHVIRGEEWLPSAPLHVHLYRCFGWEETMPEFAHLPLLLKPDGNGKLSKRDGDRLGFPVFPLRWTDPKTGETSSGYRESGYLPEAFINMLAFLGWNPGTEQEIFSLNELIDAFSLERVGKHGSKFDPEKARWFNHQYLQKKSDSDILPYLRDELTRRNIAFSDDYLLRVVKLIRERITLIPDAWDQSWFFFLAPETYDEKVVEKVWAPVSDIRIIVEEFAGEVEQLSGWDHESIHAMIQEFISRKGLKMGQLMNPIRLLVVGSNQGPGMMDIAETIGKAEFVRRIRRGVQAIG